MHRLFLLSARRQIH